MEITEAICRGTISGWYRFDFDNRVINLKSVRVCNPPPANGDHVILQDIGDGWRCEQVLNSVQLSQSSIKEVVGDIWDYWERRHWICVTTNGDIRSDGLAVMGRGIAKQAAERFPSLPRELATHLRRGVNTPCVFHDYRLVTFPTKYHWRDKSDIPLIVESYKSLTSTHIGAIWHNHSQDGVIYLPRPGCNNGQLDWDDVRAALEPISDKNVTIIRRDE
jgi:hypothetical protein